MPLPSLLPAQEHRILFVSSISSWGFQRSDTPDLCLGFSFYFLEEIVCETIRLRRCSTYITGFSIINCWLLILSPSPLLLARIPRNNMSLCLLLGWQSQPVISPTVSRADCQEALSAVLSGNCLNITATLHSCAAVLFCAKYIFFTV